MPELKTWEAEILLPTLKQICPSLVFDTSYSRDPGCRWDGDKNWHPDDEGFLAYDVDVSCAAVVDGELVEEEAHLGGTWEKPNEHCPDIGGYLLQMQLEAAEHLYNHKELPENIRIELAIAIQHLTTQLELRYDHDVVRGLAQT